jgi:GNAT superfamily N-acetyltransferase
MVYLVSMQEVISDSNDQDGKEAKASKAMDALMIRFAVPADAMDVATVHVRSWQAAYRGLLPKTYLDGLRAEDRASRYDFTKTDPGKPQTILAAGPDGTILGFATTCARQDDDLVNAGELCALYVDPDFWNAGVGASLIVAARARLLELGVKTAYLWLLDGNLRGGRFYVLDGWAPDGQIRKNTVWGISVSETRYQRAL